MKVLVVGFPKTGTKTLTAALKQLGYSVYDYEENGFYLYKDWMNIFTVGGTKEDFYRMFKDVDVACDTPACIFWKEILEAFPDMKMIFMRRKSEDEWYRSLKKQIDVVESSWGWKLITIFSLGGRRILHFSHYINRITAFGPSGLPFYKTYGGISPTLAKMRYRQHNASVMLEAPKEQTLELDLARGWEPLCKFLEKPIPNIPFPHENIGGRIVEEHLNAHPITTRLFKEAVAGFFLSVAAVCAVGYFSYKYLPRKLSITFS